MRCDAVSSVGPGTRKKAGCDARELCAHAGAAINEALMRGQGKKPMTVFNLSGHGLLDMSAYDANLNAKLNNGR
jgi:predicted alternative tryptophan synthase beta-subunit